MKVFRLILFVISITYSANICAQSVFTTKTGEKYHTETCRYLKYSKKEIILEKAKLLGLTPCSVCKPIGNNSKTTKTTNSSGIKNNTKPSSKATATQCTGKTQSGTRCKRMTKNSSGRCYQH